MLPFHYVRARDAADAVACAAGQPRGAATSAAVQFLAGGTLMLDLMKLGAMSPQTLVDIEDLRARHDYTALALQLFPRGRRGMQ